ncbi:putative N-alpha-acetyltransferase 25, NatB auxiliary subunit isoform X1 [Trypanosoma theileri]|uniref:Putative N-alpha-acetyltransferase 25, NatB auxiliary subunit isoform X1 n=1 Tax=Trypanosoma theileri TaxID=67003 RepID=A0A1X0P396_9TRYP|nr:putative N-alpha-acetyltransferase 25, NatB auxiliary subunit isoform X1 [Trypanosoma theileri]ORC91029.1 putative N-alpha-acetyltransferase 25, NatB auxiliary subunit isoform X1 [Trypanosoma theileri]
MSSVAVDRAATRVFDLIDAGKLGLAEGALEDALPKFSTSHALLAAESLLLLKKGQAEKAREKAEALSQQNVTDGKALSALVYVLQQCCSWVALAQTYDRMKEGPNERNILENLLQTYVRMGAFDQVQKSAVQLHRKWNDPRYQVWVVQANLARVPPDSTDHVLLKVSTRLLKDVILTDNGLISPSTCRMYIEVLHQQKLYNEAVEFLCSERGVSVGVPDTRLELLATSLQLNGELAKANTVAKHLWSCQPDNWTFVELYLNTLSETNTGNGILTLDGPEERRITLELSNVDCSLTDALRFCKDLQNKILQVPNGRPCRGPFMAELETLSRQGSMSALQQATLTYAQRFYKIACCFLDISTYLDKSSAAAIYLWSKTETESETGNNSLHYHTQRILGLRCHVALWGTGRDNQPDDATVEDLLQTCWDLYEKAKPLSTHLAWSEEGLCDGYITVALNIILHLYHATKEKRWVEKGLELLEKVERKLNNPMWLMFATCFARILGFADCDAWRQLSFKSVQHDTMSHIGYWPLVTGGALEEIYQWNELAWGHYNTLEKDCSLLRSKVFLYMSWSAMKDVQEYERRQTNSLGRVICSVHRIAGSLRSCQTRSSICELMEAESGTIADAYKALQSPEVLELTDNTDWVVVRSMVLGNIHSDKVKELTDTLVDMPSRMERIEHTCQLLGSLILLHDIALLESHHMRLANAPKPKKAKGAQINLEQQFPLPTLLSDSYSGDSLPTLPVIRSIAPVLLQCIQTRGSGSAISHTTHLHDSLQTVVNSERMEHFLFPEALILSSFLQVAPVRVLPIAAWAKDLEITLRKVYESQMEVKNETALGQVKKLRDSKAQRMSDLSRDLLRDVSAAGRRR